MFFNSVSPVKLTTETPLVTKCVQKNRTAKIKQIKRSSKRTKRSDALKCSLLKIHSQRKKKIRVWVFHSNHFLALLSVRIFTVYYLSKRPLSLWVYRRNNPRGQLVEQTYRPRDDSTVFIDYYWLLILVKQCDKCKACDMILSWISFNSLLELLHTLYKDVEMLNKTKCSPIGRRGSIGKQFKMVPGLLSIVVCLCSITDVSYCRFRDCI